MQALDTTSIDSLRTVLDYAADVAKIEEDQPESGRGERSPFKIPVPNTALKVLFVAGSLLLLYLLLRLIAAQLRQPANPAATAPVSDLQIQQIEDNLPDANIDDPLQNAVAAGDHNLAVRLLYLLLLQELTKKGRIQWKKDKTNGAYLRELSGTPLFENFSRLTLVFERAWYGKALLSAAQYQLIESGFRQALSALDE